MLIIAQDDSLMTTMVADHDTKFDQSQLIRIEAIASLNEAGKALLRIQDKFKEAKASGSGLIETDLGDFKNFDDYLVRGSSIKKTKAYDYIKLANNWNVVLALGMQDTTCSKTLAKSMRLCRTLKIISWYNQCLKEGRPESGLTLDQYWFEDDQRRLKAVEARKMAEAELQLLRTQIEVDAVPQETYNYVLEGYQRTVAELEQTKKELEKAKLELAALKPKTYKFTPPTETPTRNPFVSV
jgi:hypothetical protein